MSTVQRIAALLNAEEKHPYKNRVVGRDCMPDGGLVSTAYVYDGRRPYETLVCSPDYHDDMKTLRDATVVACYATEEDARDGHAKWTARYRDNLLPDPLILIENSVDPVGTSSRAETSRKGDQNVVDG
jgi:hypothetical protein